MAKFIITGEFWEVFPQAEIAVVLAKGKRSTTCWKKAVKQPTSTFRQRCSAKIR